MGDKAEQLNSCESESIVNLPRSSAPPVVKYLKGPNAPINDLEGDANVESDCEGDSTGVGDETLKKEQEEESRAVLLGGSFSAYERFLAPLPR